ncbi:MAG TPA: maleylpyruvate isomerase family mycothiol-dependent enzyme [Streptosporangiaceae bacterium]|nr:maleylpyruvate isomerase family mycothiol-dependent enzyme [Streptosporangiaceae bacterium]HXZ64745.1 maleylpyruvate isomerase family mycothiol-dependent enzyme [Streptosporangiaceae bacterium]
MQTALGSVRADGDALLDIGAELTREQWQAPSGCEGWRVQDVVTHLANLFWLLADPRRLPPLDGLPTEQAQETAVQARRGRSGPAALADYAESRGPALDRLVELAGLDLEVPLGDLGTYPAALLPAAYSFDHYTHIRADLFPPRGPLPGQPPQSDAERLASVLDWIEVALPQQNPAAALACTLELEVTGTGARSIPFGSGGPAATISSDGPALVRWVTQRGTWAGLGVRAAGDPAALAVARTLKVF